MSTPKVSILLPCLNAASFLEERIDSILAQTFSNWEAIVLDSCSKIFGAEIPGFMDGRK
jgi:glycosyltransferase involved in cell wall biosynthesis